MSGPHPDIPLTAIVSRQPQSGPAAPSEEVDLGSGAPSLTGLGPLRSVSQLKVKQKIRLKDVCGDICGCEAGKKYAIQGPEGDTLYWAKESSDCCRRCLLANIRPLRLSLQDQTGAEIFNLERPLNCSGCCCWFAYPHCTQKIKVTSSSFGEIGFIRERATWCNPVYHVFDPLSTQLFKVRGPCCHFCCGDVTFEVLDCQRPSSAPVARITKKWLGMCVETALDADHFVVDFADPDLRVEDKALILATVFLIDLMYYEGDSI